MPPCFFSGLGVRARSEELLSGGLSEGDDNG